MPIYISEILEAFKLTGAVSKRTTKIILQFLKDYKSYDCTVCSKMSRKNKNFREFPDEFYE